jgi:hypothetical protein
MRKAHPQIHLLAKIMVLEMREKRTGRLRDQVGSQGLDFKGQGAGRHLLQDQGPGSLATFSTVSL